MTMSRLLTHPATFAAIIAAALYTLLSCASPQTADGNSGRRVVIIFYDPATGKESITAELARHGSEVVYDYAAMHGMAVTAPRRWSMARTLRHYGRIDGVQGVTADRTMQLH